MRIGDQGLDGWLRVVGCSHSTGCSRVVNVEPPWVLPSALRLLGCWDLSATDQGDAPLQAPLVTAESTREGQSGRSRCHGRTATAGPSCRSGGRSMDPHYGPCALRPAKCGVACALLTCARNGQREVSPPRNHTRRVAY